MVCIGSRERLVEHGCSCCFVLSLLLLTALNIESHAFPLPRFAMACAVSVSSDTGHGVLIHVRHFSRWDTSSLAQRTE